MKSRAVFLVGLTAAILLGTALRLHTRPAAVRGETVEPLDSDSAYHMRRARFAAASFPRTILFDPLMNFPAGGVAIWPPLFDLALAAPARIAHGAGASSAEVARGAAAVPVVLAALAIVLAGLLARSLYGPVAGAAAALFLAVCPGHVLWSQYAHTDQHVAESACGLAVLLAYVTSRLNPDSSRRAAGTGILLAVAVLTWQGAIYWGAIVALSLVLERLRTGKSVAREAAWMLALPAALTALATACWWTAAGIPHPPLTYVSFGFFQPLFLAAMAGGVATVDLAIGAFRRETSGPRLLAALILFASLAATFPFARELVTATLNGVLYSAGTTQEIPGASSMGYISYPKNWLHGIFEARPLLADGPAVAWRQLSAAFFLSPLAILVWIARAARGYRPGAHLALAVWGGVTLFLALSQRLDVYYAAPLAALTLIEAARFVAARLPQLPRSSAVAAAGAGLLLAWPMAGGIAEELRTRYVPGSDFFDTLERLRTATARASAAPLDAYDPRLLGPPPFPAALDRAQAILAPWSAGHWILYESERPVVANNFGYGFLDSIRFFLAESESEALALAKRRRARWILTTDLTPRLNDYASYLGQPPLVAGAPAPGSPDRSFTPAYFRTMQARLYEFDGKGANLPGLPTTVEPVGGVRLLFHSQSAIRIRHGDRWVALWKVFEITE
ncbi:MAG TPA: STT3 domain-containing protein [Thermoanaerobaculia bacterium]